MKFTMRLFTVDEKSYEIGLHLITNKFGCCKNFNLIQTTKKIIAWLKSQVSEVIVLIPTSTFFSYLIYKGIF